MISVMVNLIKVLVGIEIRKFMMIIVWRLMIECLRIDVMIVVNVMMYLIIV